MANPQTENGYTTIANEILENIYNIKFNGVQFRIILIIWRYTYGFKRKGHNLSENFIAEASKVDKRRVRRELKKLIDGKIILVTKKQIGTKAREIVFNKNYEEWCFDKFREGKLAPTKKIVREGKLAPPREGKLAPPREGKLAPQEIKKTKYKEKELYDFYLSLDLIKHKNFTKAMQNAIKKAMRENKYSIEDCKELLKRHKEVVLKTKDDTYPVKVRSLDSFFGQKVHNATHLICSEYEDGGCRYEKIAKDKPKHDETGDYVGWR